MAKSKVGKTVGSLGEYLKEQRVSASMSLRQLAEQAGVSNPYLSQIERGLRKPSAEVLQQIAKALRISAEQVYVRAGILSPHEHTGGSVELAILGDTQLTERQKRSLLDVYQSFLALNGRAVAAEPTEAAGNAADAAATPDTPDSADDADDADSADTPDVTDTKEN
ncbi:MAG: helix-turn-helix transcriptional regulator [Nocardioides sp.]|uniref:helix-turn-helix domain-containing protein n=1 Tax=Nocardioides sp. TaxID=35761 RepID=UPI0039E6BCBB